jgi:MFS family permease
MIFSIFGPFLKDEIGVNLAKIGFLDGAVESFSFAMKVFSGVISDFLMNRKMLILLGAIFLFAAKPLEAIATSYYPLFAAKILERLGNGLQSTPRDAIVGDWAPKNIKATCFAMRHALAAFGSVVGGILASILLMKTGGNYRFVFWLACIPTLLSIIVIAVFVKDKRAEKNFAKRSYRKITLSDIKNFQTQYWILIIVACTYMMAKVTESLIVIHFTNKLNLPQYLAPICMICYQLASSFVALPAGIMSDRIKNRENFFIIGIIVFILSDILFIFGNNFILIIIATLFLGAYVGISQSIFPAKIIDIVPKDLKGTGISIFNLACSVSLLIGGTIAGYVAEKFSLQAAFISSSCLATISLIVLFISKSFNKSLSD